MSSWAAPRAAFAQQLMGFGLGQLAQMEENKENDRRFQMAEKAEKDRENARREWEKTMLQYRQELADEGTDLYTAINPETGQVERFSRAQAKRGEVVPQSILSQQQREREQAANKAALDEESARALIESRVSTAERNRAQADRARAQAQQARAPGEGRGGLTQPAEQQPPMSTSELNNVRSQLLNNNNNDPKAAYERARVLYGPEAADQIFPGIGNPQRRGLMQGAMDAATGFMRRASGGSDIDELLSKYNN